MSVPGSSSSLLNSAEGSFDPSRNFRLAAHRGELTTMEQLLLRHGRQVEIDAPEDGWTALMAAAFGGEDEVVSFLLRHNADPNFSNDLGQTPLHVAAEQNHSRVVIVLLNFGAQHTKDAEGRTPLFLACREGNAESARELLHHGVGGSEHRPADPDAADDKLRTPLHVAAKKNHAAVIEMLAGAGANLDAMDSSGRSALHYAAFEGHLEATGKLVALGATIDNQTPSNRRTPLLAAAYKGHAAVAKVLLRGGADANFATRSGDTALHYACSKGHEDVIRVLLEYDADASVTNRKRETPAQKATDAALLFRLTEMVERRRAERAAASAVAPSAYSRSHSGDRPLVLNDDWRNASPPKHVRFTAGKGTDEPDLDDLMAMIDDGPNGAAPGPRPLRPDGDGEQPDSLISDLLGDSNTMPLLASNSSPDRPATGQAATSSTTGATGTGATGTGITTEAALSPARGRPRGASLLSDPGAASIDVLDLLDSPPPHRHRSPSRTPNSKGSKRTVSARDDDSLDPLGDDSDAAGKAAAAMAPSAPPNTPADERPAKRARREAGSGADSEATGAAAASRRAARDIAHGLDEGDPAGSEAQVAPGDAAEPTAAVPELDAGVASVLITLGLGAFADIFAREYIDLETLTELSEADLKELGVPMGPRKKIIKWIRKQRPGE